MQSASSATARTRLHVLLYDRDAAVLEVMRASLAAMGARVSVAASVDEVLRIAEEERVDVVATDDMLSARDRCELVIALKTAPVRRLRELRVMRLRCCA